MKISRNIWWALTAVLGFAGVILIFQNNNAYAGAHGLESTYVVTGSVLIIAAIYCLTKVAKLSKPTNED